ncbi:hypothetical protein [Pseudomonas sp. SST3]|uniref:hypothetical protein n=1 Tax=Pseudomonas sp. SST3 TaxID=2267882 RepID=UPI000E045A71|nr:hypothetical protein [Pseudomonas sp. SST3]NKQ12843.1 hypothetical protein [Pseudomonas sp. SST3]
MRKHICVMFMLAVTGVLGAAGFLFKQLSQHHFDQLDSHALEEKLHASRSLLEVLGDLSKLRCLAPAAAGVAGRS